jgi:hypothetical protein
MQFLADYKKFEINQKIGKYQKQGVETSQNREKFKGENF